MKQTIDVVSVIQACKQGKRAGRAELYRLFYNYAMSVCLRYSDTRESAQDIVNDGFVKIFTKLDKNFDEQQDFKPWLRRLMINTAIDTFRKNEKHRQNRDLQAAGEVGFSADILSHLTEKEIMSAVQQLPPSYRYVFNLYVVEGYKHHEIATALNISEGTSKSNLAKARTKLKSMLKHLYTQDYGR